MGPGPPPRLHSRRLSPGPPRLDLLSPRRERALPTVARRPTGARGGGARGRGHVGDSCRASRAGGGVWRRRLSLIHI
eukprot:169923-Rhodomonas_salina.1